MTRARDLSNFIGSGSFSSTTFTATAGQTAFTIAHTQGFVQVFMNGLLLDLTTDYTSNGSAITLTSAAVAGDEIEVVKYDAFSVGDAVPASGGTFTGNVNIPGHVVQVVQATLTAQSSTTSDSFVNLFSATITPTSNTSKILVRYHSGLSMRSAVYSGAMKLQRGSTDIFLGDALDVRTRATTMAWSDTYDYMVVPQVNEFLDSPATTSATTYNIVYRSGYTGNAVHVGRSFQAAHGVANHTYPSSLTLMEIAQ